MSTAKRKLLLIACSNRKVRTKGLLPAIERYDGVTYRVIRKAMREGYFPPNVDIKILSAKYGLIDAEKRIAYYDRRMDGKRARELRGRVQRKLRECLAAMQYVEVYIDLGIDYLPVVDGVSVPQGCILKWTKGRIGKRLHRLILWLKSSRG